MGLNALALLLVSVAVTSCAPTPATLDPSPSQSPVTSMTAQEQAYREAEETYRKYVAALNAVDLADPATFEPVYALTAGGARQGSRSEFTRMRDDGWHVEGETKVVLVEALPGGSASEVELAVCLDVRAVKVTDDSGISVVPASRPDHPSMTVSLMKIDSHWLISEFAGRAGEPTCH